MPTRNAATPVFLRRRGAAFFVAALFLVASTLVSCTPPTEETESPEISSGVVDNLPKAAPTSERIAAALAAGEIDKPTSPLYRLWAQFGDRSLPEQYRGAPEPHDLSVLVEVQDTLENMPTEIRTQIEPFFQRPSNSGSAFSDRAEDTKSAESENTQSLSILNAGQSEDSADAQRCAQDWASEAVPGLPFRVWACPDEGMDVAQRTIATVSDALEARVGNMLLDAPDGMGAPIPDEPDADANQPSDDKIDIYVLPGGWFAPERDLNERQLDDISAAITMPATPCTETSSSAYILLGSHLLEEQDPLERVLVHEVFHVLQLAHFRGVDLNAVWVFEASAVWAAMHFTSDPWVHTYRHHMTVMQDNELSLFDPDFGHRYSAFLWFLFMQQEASPEAVFGVWNALNSAPAGVGSDSVPAAIDSQLSLDSAFPEFVMRLLNANLPGDPVTPRFVEIAPNFLDGETPELPAEHGHNKQGQED